MPTTYEVKCQNGDILGVGLTACQAADEVLRYDGNTYEVRNDNDGFFTLYTSQRFTTKLVPTVISVLASSRDVAWPLIANEVVKLANEWDGPRVYSPDDDVLP